MSIRSARRSWKVVLGGTRASTRPKKKSTADVTTGCSIGERVRVAVMCF